MLDKETCNHASLVTDWSSSFAKSLEESMFERRWFYLKVSATGAMMKIANNLKSLLDGVSSVVTWLPKTSTSCCRPGARERWRTSNGNNFIIEYRNNDIQLTCIRGNSEDCPKNIWNPAFFSNTEPSLTLKECSLNKWNLGFFNIISFIWHMTKR